MALASGTKLGPYEIQSPLGAGGMGEVYRARDTRLDRTVAVKILPPHLTNNPEAKQRFEREARAISSLSHQNICHLYDVGSQDGTDYLVMEFLEGETLAARLAKGPLTLPQVLKCGVEVCEGLEKAHRSGVVHRDLKPGNIMLTKSGAKIMDFGLAKATAVPLAESSDQTIGSGPTAVSHPITARGTVIGTFQYMSPEQVEGKELDARSDIFSFGAVLYEMVTGKRAFDGKSQLSVASAILEREPEPITATQPMSPPALDHVVRSCLEKDPESRWQSAGDIARELRWITASGSQAGVAPPVRLRRKARERVAWGAVVAVLVALVIWSNLRGQRPERVVRAFLPPPPEAAFYFTGDYSGAPALSRDGTRVAFCAISNSVSAVWVQSLDSGSATKLDGTEGAAHPFWSPDGRFVGFFAEGKLKRIPFTGGPATAIADAPNPRGGSWNNDNVILYAADYRDTIWRVSANGGTPARATKLDFTKHSTHRWPFFLPDGKHFLYFAGNHNGGIAEQNGIYFASLDGDTSKLVVATDSGAQYASGRLLFHFQSSLMTQKFDPATGALSGEAVPLADQVQYDIGTWRTTFSVSDNGVLLYEPGTKTQGMEFVWMDRTGKQVGTVGGRASYQGMRISPDGRQLAVAMGDTRTDLYVIDLARGLPRRLTFGPAGSLMPSWSADGQKVLFSSRMSAFDVEIHARPANGGGQDELLLKPDQPGVGLVRPEWTRDGRYIVYQRITGPGGWSVWAVPTSGEKKPFPVLQPQNPQGSIIHARLSPDSQWLAFSATDSGQEEVFVTRFPSGTERWQISQHGATCPTWRADGKEIFFVSADAPIRLFAAAVKTSSDRFEVENIRPLFPIPNSAALDQLFDVTPDGQRFLVPTPPKGGTGPMTLVLNWTAELKKK